MSHQQAGRVLEAHIQETTVPVQLEPVGAHVAGHGTSHHVAQPLGHAHGAHHGSVMPPHHDPHDALASDNPRHGMHDGTMYAQGATGEPYEEATPAHHGISERIKEALPGTKEHKAKKEAEGNLAVYS